MGESNYCVPHMYLKFNGFLILKPNFVRKIRITKKKNKEPYLSKSLQKIFIPSISYAKKKTTKKVQQRQKKCLKKTLLTRFLKIFNTNK